MAAQNQEQQSISSTRGIFRSFLLIAILAILLNKGYRQQLFPWGEPEQIVDRSSFREIDPNNDSMQMKHGKTQRVYERSGEGRKEHLLKGPETVVFDPSSGAMYSLTSEANLISFTNIEAVGAKMDSGNAISDVKLVHNVGIGRPLGSKFTPDGETLYIADAVLGLTRIRNPQKDPHAKVEMVANFVRDGDITTPIMFADDVAIGPKTGKVYFTDATSIPPDRLPVKAGASTSTTVWDIMYPALMELCRGVGTGRLLEYDPVTDEVKVLASSLWFSNGVAVDREERFLIVGETLRPRVWKYDLQDGENSEKSRMHVVLDSHDLPGYVDGVDCSWTNNKCYAVITGGIAPIHKLFTASPDILDRVLRSLVMLLPRSLLPKPSEYGVVVEFDPSLQEAAKMLRCFQDPSGKDVRGFTGVTEYDNKLYLGSLDNDYIGIYKLD